MRSIRMRAASSGRDAQRPLEVPRPDRRVQDHREVCESPSTYSVLSARAARRREDARYPPTPPPWLGSVGRDAGIGRGCHARPGDHVDHGTKAASTFTAHGAYRPGPTARRR
jgi:hypothetical protein